MLECSIPQILALPLDLCNYSEHKTAFDKVISIPLWWHHNRIERITSCIFQIILLCTQHWSGVGDIWPPWHPCEQRREKSKSPMGAHWHQGYLTFQIKPKTKEGSSRCYFRTGGRGPLCVECILRCKSHSSGSASYASQVVSHLNLTSVANLLFSGALVALHSCRARQEKPEFLSLAPTPDRNMVICTNFLINVFSLARILWVSSYWEDGHRPLCLHALSWTHILKVQKSPSSALH